LLQFLHPLILSLSKDARFCQTNTQQGRQDQPPRASFDKLRMSGFWWI
jgi:hypothetical protein